jgi:hypothetical protein
MAPTCYTAYISRLMGPGKTSYFEVELVPQDHLPGRVPTARVRVVFQEKQDASPERVAAKAREVVASVATSDWLRAGTRPRLSGPEPRGRTPGCALAEQVT